MFHHPFILTQDLDNVDVIKSAIQKYLFIATAQYSISIIHNIIIMRSFFDWITHWFSTD